MQIKPILVAKALRLFIGLDAGKLNCPDVCARSVLSYSKSYSPFNRFSITLHNSFETSFQQSSELPLANVVLTLA